jgi:hypothetical protein
MHPSPIAEATGPLRPIVVFSMSVPRFSLEREGRGATRQRGQPNLGEILDRMDNWHKRRQAAPVAPVAEA